MSTADERLTERLRELPSDVLAEVLVRQTKGNPRLRERLVDLTTNAKEKASGVLRALGGLRRSKPVQDESELLKLSKKLHGILADIQAVAKSSPPRAFELICEFILHDAIVAGIVNDPLGVHKYIYRGSAPMLAAQIALRYTDSDHMVKCLLPLLEEDPIGARSSLIEHLGPVVPNSVLQAALDAVDERLPLPRRSPLPQKDYPYYIRRSLLIALCDTDAFVEWCTHAGVLDVIDTLVLVRLHMGKGEYDVALRWLDTVRGHKGVVVDVHHLQAAINTALGRETSAESYHRERFLAKPDVKTFASLAKSVSALELASIIDAFQNQVATAPKLLASTLKVLIAAGRGNVAEDIVSKRCTYAHADTNSWSRIAQVFSDSDMPLGAYIAYRAMLNNILEHKRTTSYYMGAEYYETLWAIAAHIVDWRGVQDHTTYIADIFERHAELGGFWIRAELSFKAPKVSRFTLPLKQRYKYR